MIKLIYYFSAVILLMSSCQEQVPIGLDSNTPQGDDSVYTVSSIPTPQQKHVLVEEFTGVRCANCPTGAALLKSIELNSAHKVLTAKMYSYSFNQSKVSPNDYELKNSQAEEIASFLNCFSKPMASIDRTKDGNNYYFPTPSWSQQISTQLSAASPINIDITKSVFNATEKKVDVEVNFTVTQPITGNLNYSIYVLEDSIIAGQDSSTTSIPNYLHNEVMQQCVTPTGVGTSFPSKFVTATAGNAMRKKLTFDLASRILNPNNCKIMVFVHRNEGTNKDVLQVVEKHLE